MMLGDSSLATIPTVDATTREGFRCLNEACGLVDGQSLSFIEVTGRDRARFIHNLCTNDVLRLISGTGCEAFVTNVQGKTVGHGIVYSLENSLVFVTVPGQQEKLLAHWDRYLITEDVQLVDRTDLWHAWLIGGPKGPAVLENFLGSASAEVSPRLEAAPITTCATESAAGITGHVQFYRVPWLAGWACLVVGEASMGDMLPSALQSAGAQPANGAAFHLARIEAGYPWFGWDITDKNLPQEVDRTEQAISFRKGCYLGQETVARLDALGHVNRLLTRLEASDARVPAAGESVMADGQSVGEITSAGQSPRNGHGQALAYVRCSARDAASPLTTATHVSLSLVRSSGH